MPNASVRLVFLVTIVAASGSSLLAQNASLDRFRAGVALGTAIPNGYSVDVPGEFGIHLQFTGAYAPSVRIAIRGDILGLMLSGTVATPSCVPGATCRGYALHPDQVYAASVSAELHTFDAAPRLYTLLGVGAYHARGPESTNFGTTLGVSGGGGFDLGRPGGFSIEARYHYLPNEFGTLTGMLVPSLAIRF